MPDAHRMPPEPPGALEAAGWSLRTVAPADWPLEAELSCDPEVVRWTFYDAELTPLQAQDRIQHFAEEAAVGSGHRYVILDIDGVPVGFIGFGLDGPHGVPRGLLRRSARPSWARRRPQSAC